MNKLYKLLIILGMFWAFIVMGCSFRFSSHDIRKATPLEPKLEYIGRKFSTGTVLMYTVNPPIDSSKVVHGMVRNHGTETNGTISRAWDIMWDDISPLNLNDSLRIRIIPTGTEYEIIDQFIVTTPNGFSNVQEYYFVLKDSTGETSECPFDIIEFDLDCIDNSYRSKRIEWVENIILPKFKAIDESGSIDLLYSSEINHDNINQLLTSLHMDSTEAVYSLHTEVCNGTIPGIKSVITFYDNSALLTFLIMAKQINYDMNKWETWEGI